MKLVKNFFNISGKKMCEMLQHYLHPCPQVCVDIGKGKISWTYCVYGVLTLQVMENLSHYMSLQHLDLSDNNIHSLGDLHSLSKLKANVLKCCEN